MKKETVKLNYSDKDNFYIYGDIDDTIPNEIISPMRKQLEIKKKEKKPTAINIFLSSYGGVVSYCFEIIGLIEEFKKAGIEVNTYTHSHVCSAASLIAVSGSKRYGGKRAYHLLHFARGNGFYSHNPIMIERNAENFKFLQKELVKIYEQYTKIKDLEEKLLADNYMINGGDAMLKAGLIDEIL